MSAGTEVRAVGPTSSRPPEARVVLDKARSSACVHCGKPLEPQKAGWPRRTCSKTCRNAAYVRRARGLAEDLPRMPHRGRRPLAGLLADGREVKR